MARRSLQTSTAGMEKARKAFKRKAWTQQYLARVIGIETRQPIWKFFSGKPIERHIFIDICGELGLDWQEIADLPTDNLIEVKNKQQDEECKIEALVETVRTQYSNKIEALCGTIRLLDIAQPVNLDKIYVNVNILPTITGQKWLDISDLQSSKLEDFDRFSLGSFYQETVSAINAVTTYSKLMVLGKPGSGKTTFLQHLAIQSIRGNFLSKQIPIFIRLKNLAANQKGTEAQTLNYLHRYINHELCNSKVSEQQIEWLLQEGKFLILLDGLDEVNQENSTDLIKQIHLFTEEYYQNNFVITSRIAAQNYIFENFTDIELADFNDEQIKTFVQNWFVVFGNNSQEQALTKANSFIKKLQQPQNLPIYELALTPILLNLACLVFQSKEDFPHKRSELYQQALNILLVRWDKARGIQRNEIYKNLSLSHKTKLISRIAAITFEHGNYFFEQNSIQKQIVNFLQTLPNVSLDNEELQFDSEVLLKSIEAQHGLLVERAVGIYSFSHLTFHEYLAAKYFVSSNETEQNLTKLVSHLNEQRWREVLLLAIEMSENAEPILQSMKQYINAIVSNDSQLQQFLTWVNQKSLSFKLPYKNAAIRAFYLTLAVPRDLVFARDLTLALALDLGLAKNLAPAVSLDLVLYRILNLSTNLGLNPTLDRIFTLSLAFPSEHDLASEPELIPLLQQLKDELPTPKNSQAKLQEWWNHNGINWTEKLREIIIQYRNLGYNWQFSEQQKQLLQMYYQANCFLLDCLHNNFTVNQSLRSEIEETLLLPTNSGFKV